MLRQIIHIDQEKCVGCGLCVDACHEGAIGLVDGKARLLREDYCDSLGDCLPTCPMDAISFQTREVPAYDEAAVLRNKAEKAGQKAGQKTALPCGCPGSACQTIATPAAPSLACDVPSCLSNFPVQLHLAPVNAPWLSGADLLIAADCTAYACGDFHRRFMQGRATLIACPKLDASNHAAKLADLLAANDVRSVTVARMTVPCCGGLTRAVHLAVLMSGKDIPVRIVTIAPDGTIRE